MGPRLIIVSNRVAVPETPRAPLAGGMAVAVKAALKNRRGMWFGWSGKVSEGPNGEPHVVDVNKITYVLIDLSQNDIQEYYNGLANSVLWPILHYRVDLQEYSRADASVLLVAELGLLPASDVRYVKTCETIGRELARNGWIMRYTAPDDFGLPETAFLACNFWYVDALSQIGRAEEARERFESILASRNSYGLLSEDIHPETGELWGNLPQTYSMAGIINTATRLSSSWEEAWARDLS